MKRFIRHTYTVVVRIGMVLLSIFADTDLPYALFILILIGFALVWSKGWKWEVVGLKKPKKFITLLLGAMLWALGIIIFSMLTIPLLSSILFGMGHNYQGVTGVILTGTIGGILGISYYIHKRNLWMPVLIHGFVDTIYISLVYTDLDKKLKKLWQ